MTPTVMATPWTLIGLDSDSGTGGTQPHQAAQTCYDLTDNGHDDWYLPSSDEMNVLYTNQTAIGGVSSGTDRRFWMADELNQNTAYYRNFVNGNKTNDNKEVLWRLRCVRTEALAPPTACSNPGGVKGEVDYNFTEGVMKYCNGSNWIAMGPRVTDSSPTGQVSDQQSCQSLGI